MNAVRSRSTCAAIGAALSLVFAGRILAADPTPVWSWARDGQEILAVRFSPDGSEIALSLRPHTLEGEEAMSLSREQFRDYLAKTNQAVRRDPRAFDPVVCILTPATGRLERVGFGYESAFAPDGRMLAFQHQKRPISGLRALAVNMAGNEIWLYDRATHRSEPLVVPETGYVAQPAFSPDGRSLAFTYMNAVNGAWSGAVGVGRIDLPTRTVSTEYAPQRAHDLPHLVDDFGFVGDWLYAVVSVPRAPGKFMATSYQVRLLSLDEGEQVDYSWGVRDAFAPPARLGTWVDGRVAVFDTAWKPVASNSPQKHEPPAGRGWRSAPGVLSPDGRKVAREFASGIVVTDATTGRRIVEFAGPNSNDSAARSEAEHNVGEMLADITWSPDSRHVAWVEKIGYLTWRRETLKMGILPQ